MNESAASLILILITSTAGENWPCNRTKAIESFRSKRPIEKWPRTREDPYSNQTIESRAAIDKYLLDKTSVCALKYTNINKTSYKLRHFHDRNTAMENGYTVTHQGRCGACSTTQDLAVYLSRNLTIPVRACGKLVLGFLIRR